MKCQKNRRAENTFFNYKAKKIKVKRVKKKLKVIRNRKSRKEKHRKKERFAVKAISW